MFTLLSDEEFCTNIIKKESDVKIIEVEIWESEMNQAEIVAVVIKNPNGVYRLDDDYEVFELCSFDMETESFECIQKEGVRIKKMLIKNLKKRGIRITSNLRY